MANLEIWCPQAVTPGQPKENYLRENTLGTFFSKADLSMYRTGSVDRKEVFKILEDDLSLLRRGVP